MKTCVVACHTHPWVDASKTFSNSIFKSLQKRQIGLPVKGPLRDSTNDKCARDFWGYSRPSFSKDRRLLNHLKTQEMGNLTFQTDDNDDSCMIEVYYNDLLLNNSNPQFKLLFKTMDHFDGLKYRLLKAKIAVQKNKGLSMDQKSFQIHGFQRSSNPVQRVYKRTSFLFVRHHKFQREFQSEKFPYESLVLRKLKSSQISV